jgi:hypothetical protein
MSGSHVLKGERGHGCRFGTGMRCTNPLVSLVSFALLFRVFAGAQTTVPPPASSAAQISPPPDTLGRTTPRGTVLGFLKAARNGITTPLLSI